MELLSRVEEKFVFKTSAVFWHIIVGAATLGIIVGICVLLYALLPVGRPVVQKATYPPEVSVSTDDLKSVLRIMPAKDPVAEPIDVEERREAIEETLTETELEKPDPIKEAHESAMENLRELIPPDKYAWKSRGRWEYPYGKDAWDRYKQARYRQWKVDRWGVEDILGRGLKNAGAKDLADATRLLNAYIGLLSQVEEEIRVDALGAITVYLKDNVERSIQNVRVLGESINNFSPDRVDFLRELASFGSKNPNDGYAFIQFANGALGTFDPAIRFDALNMLMSTYYRHFNNRIAYQRDITGPLLSEVARLPVDYQVQAIETYYELYLARKQDREGEIKRVDRQYQRDLSAAEAEYSLNQTKKITLRLLSAKVIGGCICAIAFLGLILALLSIQRGIKRINDKLETR